MKSFNQIVMEMLKIKEQDISDSLTPQDVPEWDSMNYLLFIAELENEYKVSFSMDEVIGAKNLGDIRRALASKHK